MISGCTARREHAALTSLVFGRNLRHHKLSIAAIFLLLTFVSPEAGMSLLRIASVPPAVVHPKASVLEAIEIMAEHGVGAVGVVDNGRLVGIFTERDLMLRVVLRHRHPRNTLVSEVMTAPVDTITDQSAEEEALVKMLGRHVRHLPILNAKGELAGMLSIRHLLEHRIDELAREIHSLDQYLSNDGPGG
jgi:CBS domain-containing protein